MKYENQQADGLGPANNMLRTQSRSQSFIALLLRAGLKAQAGDAPLGLLGSLGRRGLPQKVGDIGARACAGRTGTRAAAAR